MVISPPIDESATSQDAPGTTIVTWCRLEYPPEDDLVDANRRISLRSGRAFKRRRTHVADRGVSAALVIQLDNATPTILSLEKSAIGGIRGSVGPSRCTRH
jgi:hypothetical protein